MHKLTFDDGTQVTIGRLPGHYMDKEIDFELDGHFVGGSDPDPDTALANAVRGVEKRLGKKVIAVDGKGRPEK